MTFDELVRSYTAPGFYFIQIGANDGVKDDFLRAYILEFGWDGLLVEPLPDVYLRLKENYKGKGGELQFLNAAISDKDGVIDFYRHPNTCCSGLGVRTRRQKRRIKSLEKIEVRGITMGTLLEFAEKVDLIQVDVEGYDEEVVRGIPFEVVKPRIIRYEHKHLGEGRKGLEDFLALRGYSLMKEGADTIAYLAN